MKKIVILALVIGAVIGGYFFIESQKAPETAADKSSDFKITAAALLSEFDEDEVLANTKYNNKTIEISGVVSDVEINGDYVDVTFETDESMSYIIVQLIQDVKSNTSIEAGASIRLKAIYNGYQDSDLGIGIDLNQGVILN